MINKEFGGAVTQEVHREDGQVTIRVDATSPFFDGLDTEQDVLLTHGDSVTSASVASGFKVIAQSGEFVAGK